MVSNLCVTNPELDKAAACQLPKFLRFLEMLLPICSRGTVEVNTAVLSFGYGFITQVWRGAFGVKQLWGLGIPRDMEDRVNIGSVSLTGT